jgi:hypothetical protein
MAISFVGASTVTSGTSPSATFPASYQKNDLLVWICTSSATVSAPAGFDVVATQGASQFVTVATRIATRDELNSGYGGLGANTRMVMLAYRGAGALEAVPTFLTGTSTAPSTNTLTTTYANDFVLSIYANQNGATRSLTPNASTTIRTSSNTSTTLNGLWLADELKAATGVTTARTATLSLSSAWSGLQLAIIETRTVYWVGGNGIWSTPGAGTTGANWANSPGGAGGVIIPSQNDAVIVDGSSGSPTITLSGFPVCGPLTTSSATCTLSSTGPLTVNGSMTLSATTTWSATGALSLIGTGTITTNAVSITPPITISGVGQSITLGSELTTPNSMTLFNGTLTLNGFNANCLTFTINGGTFSSTTGNVSATTYTLTTGTVNMGSGNWTATGTTGTIWNRTGTVVNRGTSTIVFTSTTEVTFTGGGATYYDFYINNSGSTRVNLTGSNTFNRIYSSRTLAWNLQFTAGDTNSFVNFGLGGTSTANRVTVSSTSSTLSTVASVGNVVQNLDYVIFSNVIASVSLTGATPIRWYLGTNSLVFLNNFTPTVTGVVLDSRANGYEYYVLTSGTSWSVPANWNSADNNVYLLGGGGGSAGGISVSATGSKISGAGGGGGGFRALTNFALTPGGSTSYAIGAAGANGLASSSASTGGNGGTTTFAVTNTAGGGGGGSGTTTTSTGGTAGIGATNNGGAGAAGTFTSNLNRAGSGGGGAGGLQGPGLIGSVGASGATLPQDGGAAGAANNNLNASLFGLVFYSAGGGGGTVSAGGVANLGFTPIQFGGGGGGSSVEAGSATDTAGRSGTQGFIVLRHQVPVLPSSGNFLNFFYQ